MPISEDCLNRSLSVLIDLADMNQHGLYVAMQALNAIDELDAKAESLKDRIAALPQEDESLDRRVRGYVIRLVEKTLSDLE